MFVNQIAVFLENREGSLSDFAMVLAKANVEIIAMSIADTQEFGILRVITKDNKKALEALKKEGFAANSTNLIGIAIDDRADSLAEVMGLLKESSISIEYMYSYTRTSLKKIIILIKTSDIENTLYIFKRKNITVLDNSLL